MLGTRQTSVDTLAAVVAVQRQFIATADPRPAFELAIRLLVELSESEFGFVAGVPSGNLPLSVHATYGSDWDESTQTFRVGPELQKSEIFDLKPLCFEVACAKETVLAHAHVARPLSNGALLDPEPSATFLGLPLCKNESSLVGIVGLVNRTTGYDKSSDLPWQLAPLCDALETMIVALQQRRSQSEQQLSDDALCESEQSYRALVEASSQMVWVAGADGKVVEDSESWRVFTGQTFADLCDGGRLKAVHPDDRPRFAAQWKSCIDARLPLNLEYRLWHAASQSWRWMNDRGLCLRSADGSIRSWVGITIDIHDRKAAEAELREQHALLLIVLESTTDYIYIKDRQGRYLVVNSAAAQAIGKPISEIIGRGDSELFPAEFACQIKQGEVQLFADEQEQSYDELLPTPRGELHVSTVKNVCRDQAGRVIGLVGITRDITARHNAEIVLHETQQRLSLILRGADVGLWDWNLASNEVDYSAEWKSQLGYLPHEIAHRYEEWESRVHPDDLAPTLERVCKALETPATEYKSEFRMRHKDGSWRWLLALGSVYRDHQGQPARLLGVHIDITDRKRAEESLQASEARYRCFVDHAADALFHLDQFGRVVDVNQQACTSLGFDRSELIGMLPTEFDPDFTPERIAQTLSLMNAGETIAFDSHHRRKDGITFPVGVRVRPFWVNNVQYCIAFVRDITDRKRTEQALRESEARLRTVLESLDRVAVQAYEADGTITFWNRASELFYGYSAADAIGRDLVSLLYRTDAQQQEREIMSEAMRTGIIPAAEEIEVIRKDGSKITVFASRVVHPRPGKPAEFFCFDVDVTERKRAEEELALRQADLLHAARLTTVGQMVAELSHEVAQPLSAIGNFAAASDRILDLASNPELETLHEYVRAIMKQSQRCVDILDRLRDFSRRSLPSREECDIGGLLRDSVDLIAHELRHNHVIVQFDLPPQLPTVFGDSIQLQQVVVNLLTNARDALRDQVRERRVIHIHASAKNDSIVFDVADRGSGLSENILAQLFDPFFTTKEHGMGIGLSICQSIVKDHGGRIEAFAGQDGGATFRVHLPLSGKRKP